MVFVLFALSLATTGNAYNAASDYFTRLEVWTQAHRAQWDQVRDAAARGKNHIVLEPLPPTPRMYPTPHLTADPTHPLNRGFARYWGLNEVVMRKP